MKLSELTHSELISLRDKFKHSLSNTAIFEYLEDYIKEREKEIEEYFTRHLGAH
jgi:hypothetical protein